MQAPSKQRSPVGERTMTLKAVPFFTQLSDQELDVVRSLASEKTYPKNAVVLTEGEVAKLDAAFDLLLGLSVGLALGWACLALPPVDATQTPPGST